MDTSIFKDKVVESWGIVPLEAYGSTEFAVIATQTWSRDGLTFFPESNLSEFITGRLSSVARDPTCVPRSSLMDEVKPRTEYVIVCTNFHRRSVGPLHLGDLVQFTSLEDSKAGVRLPQMVFVSRIDDVIDMGGFTRLTEKTIWQAIEDSTIPYEEWTIRKEIDGQRPLLHSTSRRDSPPQVPGGCRAGPRVSEEARPFL